MLLLVSRDETKISPYKSCRAKNVTKSEDNIRNEEYVYVPDDDAATFTARIIHSYLVSVLFSRAALTGIGQDNCSGVL